MAAVLLVVNSLVMDQVEEKGSRARPEKMPFSYGSDEGIELQIYNSGETLAGMTWGQLLAVVRGLWLYLVEGGRSDSCHFDIFVARIQHVYIHIGWGNIVEPVESSGKSGVTAWNKRVPRIRRKPAQKPPTHSLGPRSFGLNQLKASLLNSTSLDLSAAPFRFRIPNTELTLSLSMRREPIEFGIVEALLIKANRQIQDKINEYGAGGLMPDPSFRCFLSVESVSLEIVSWRPWSHGLTWGQLADVIEGLALFYFAAHSEECYFDILYGDAEAMIGMGRVVKNEELF